MIFKFEVFVEKESHEVSGESVLLIYEQQYFLFVGVFFAVLNGAISAFNGVVDAAKGAIEAVKGLLDVMERVGGYFVQFVNYIWPGNSSQSSPPLNATFPDDNDAGFQYPDRNTMHAWLMMLLHAIQFFAPAIWKFLRRCRRRRNRLTLLHLEHTFLRCVTNSAPGHRTIVLWVTRPTQAVLTDQFLRIIGEFIGNPNFNFLYGIVTTPAMGNLATDLVAIPPLNLVIFTPGDLTIFNGHGLTLQHFSNINVQGALDNLGAWLHQHIPDANLNAHVVLRWPQFPRRD
ncbi:hypothetical protein Fcan01_11558 [Folsomia candida]|uniref:Uncharacterized protein n=1 Tax=Folsomia candida TaxID=158441 RepID=A0A226EA65_FOLCA|nr:hypothetical protein Fcan01_11558 [Folsomia candida]